MPITVEQICEWLADEDGINDDIVCDTLNDEEVESQYCWEYCDRKYPTGECYLRYFKYRLEEKENGK